MSKKLTTVKYFVTVSLCHKADIILKFDTKKEAEDFVNTCNKSVIESSVDCFSKDRSDDDKVDIWVEETEFYSDGECQSYPYWVSECDVKKNYSELQKEIDSKDEVETNDDQVDDAEVDDAEVDDAEVDDDEDDCMNKYELTKFDVQRYLEDNYNEEELKENVLHNRERFEAEVFDALLIEDEDVLSGAIADVLDDLDMKYFYNYDAE